VDSGSDHAADLALRSAFAKSKKMQGVIGAMRKPPGGTKFKFPSLSELQQAREELDARDIEHRTLEEKDGEYVLAVEKGFDPEEKP